MDPDSLFDSDLILSSNGIGGHRKKELNLLQKKIKLGLLPHGLKAASHGGIVESKVRVHMFNDQASLAPPREHAL